MGRGDREEGKKWLTRCALALSSELGMQAEIGWIGGDFGVEEQMHVLYRREWHSTSIHVGGFDASDPASRGKLRDRIAAELRRIRDGAHGRNGR